MENRLKAGKCLSRYFIRFLKKASSYIVRCLEPACDPNSRRYVSLEERIPFYTLPDPLVALNGMRVEDPRIWYDYRRPELLNLFQVHVYGKAPLWTYPASYSLISVDDRALGGVATCKEIRITIGNANKNLSIALLLYLPNKVMKSRKKVPVFLGLDFCDNRAFHEAPARFVTKNRFVTMNWILNNSITGGRPPEQHRGVHCSNWPIEMLLSCGYGLATICYGEIVPDHKNGIEEVMNRLYPEKAKSNLGDNSWGAIDGWAWGLCRAMDYIEQDYDLDSKKVVVMGHSRLGKAALWAGALDQRFAIVISNESGCAGAALSRRRFGETVAQINSSYPHWFCEKFKQYSNKEWALPVDQHELISLIAPRPIYISSAQRDLEADPMGEFLAAKYASPVYRLLGTSGLPTEEFPAVNTPIMGAIGYHIRKGYHDIKKYDWEQFIAFAKIHSIA